MRAIATTITTLALFLVLWVGVIAPTLHQMSTHLTTTL